MTHPYNMPMTRGLEYVAAKSIGNLENHLHDKTLQ